VKKWNWILFALAACAGCAFSGDYQEQEQHQQQVVETTHRTVVSGSAGSSALQTHAEVQLDERLVDLGEKIVDRGADVAEGWFNLQTGGLGGLAAAAVSWLGRRAWKKRKNRKKQDAQRPADQ
jgi:hypothetical protein